MLVPIIVSLLAAIAAPIGAYLVAARRLSGKIGTSDAAELWDEAARMREHLTARLDTAYERASTLEERISTLEKESRALRAEHREQVRALEERIESLERDNAALRHENQGLRARVHELELHSGEAKA